MTWNLRALEERRLDRQIPTTRLEPEGEDVHGSTTAQQSLGCCTWTRVIGETKQTGVKYIDYR